MVQLATHALICCESSRYLYKLYNEKHCHPYQLQRCPDCQDHRERVSQYDFADGLRKDVTLTMEWRWKILKIYSMVYQSIFPQDRRCGYTDRQALALQTTISLFPYKVCKGRSDEDC